MKENYLRRIGAAALLCVVGFFFLGAAPDPETAAVERLLERRADVMSGVLLDKISYDEGKRLLHDVEKDKLYNDDLESLQKYGASDIDMATDMKVVKLRKTGQLYDMLTFEGEISWRHSGENGSFGHKDEYHVSVAEEDGQYRLVSFELL